MSISLFMPYWDHPDRALCLGRKRQLLWNTGCNLQLKRQLCSFHSHFHSSVNSIQSNSIQLYSMGKQHQTSRSRVNVRCSLVFPAKIKWQWSNSHMLICGARLTVHHGVRWHIQTRSRSPRSNHSPTLQLHLDMCMNQWNWKWGKALMHNRKTTLDANAKDDNSMQT